MLAIICIGRQYFFGFEDGRIYGSFLAESIDR